MFPTILNEFFVQRTEAWFRIVIQEGLGFSHYWYRFEFAKSRGAIHFHSLLFDTDKSRLLHGCLDHLRQLFPDFLQGAIDFASQAPSSSDINDAEQELVHELVGVLPTVFAPMTALHPAGRTLEPLPGHDAPPTDLQGSFNWSPWAKARLAAAGAPGFPTINAETRTKLVRGTDVPPSEIGNLFLWPPHEGLASPPNKRSLRLWPFEVAVAHELEDKVDFSNSATLHSCSSYCLRQKGKSIECRSGFGRENKTVPSRCDGKPATAEPSFQVIRGVSHLVLPRDHPRLVQGCPLLGRSFSSNTDWQVSFLCIPMNSLALCLFQIFIPLSLYVAIPILSQIVVAMFEDLFSLPDIGVDIYEAFTNLDDAIAELIRPPQEGDPPDVVEACKHNQDFLTGLRELYHSRPYLDKINYCECLINYLVAYA